MKKNRTSICGIGINDADYVINRSEKINGIQAVSSVLEECLFNENI